MRLLFTQVARLLAIATILAAAGGAFALTAGWLTPGRLAPGRIVDALERHDGRHPGFRRAHAKGICVEGRFVSDGGGSGLSHAQMFARGDMPVTGRFSTGGGQPFAADGRVTFRSMALSLTQPNGEQWRTAMDDTPIFPVATPQAFLDLQLATSPDPGTGKADAARVAAFLAHHPETRAFLDWQSKAPLASSFGNTTYFSINAFRFTNEAGEVRHVRWSFVPEQPFDALDKGELASMPPNFLFDDLTARLQRGPLRWHLLLSVATAEDPVDDATRQWPPGRQQVDAGTLVIERAVAEEQGTCRNITFDPLVLPSGIAPSGDPLLAARSAVYAVSLARRDGEVASRRTAP